MYNGFRHSFLPWSLNLVTLNIFHLWACGPEVHHLHLTIWGLPPPLSLQEESVCICVLCHISGLHNPPSGTWPSGGHLPPWGPAGLRPPTVSAPELSCPLKWGQAFHPLHFYLMTAWSLICTIFSLSLSFLLHIESLGGEEQRPEGPPPKATTFMSTVVVWPSYLEQTCPRESALGLSLIKFAHPITDVNLKGEVGVGREWEAEENVHRTPPHTHIWSCLI